jgi:hypothetical protein
MLDELAKLVHDLPSPLGLACPLSASSIAQACSAAAGRLEVAPSELHDPEAAPAAE